MTESRRPLTRELTLALLCAIDKEMPAPRAAKLLTLYDLAKEADPATGAIVELGTFLGYGAIALWYGSFAGKKASVFTVDAYVDRQGWANELYGLHDYSCAIGNFHRASIIHPRNYDGQTPFFGQVIDDALRAANDWNESISLFFWDLGVHNSVAQSLDAWRNWFVSGTVLALHDTNDGRLGCKTALVNFGINEDEIEIRPGGILVARIT